jgi:hypothetical protein
VIGSAKEPPSLIGSPMIAITFDTDHMSERSMETFLSTFDVPGSATFFCTRRFECLAGSRHERAIHPFLNATTDWVGATRELANEVGGDIVGVRSHSCTASQQYAVQLHAMGFLYVSHAIFPGHAGLKPFRHPWGVWEMPIYYMDNMDYEMRELIGEGHRPFEAHNITTALANPDSLFVFDFHPVHILHDTRRRADYQSWVAAAFFRSLIDQMVEAGVESRALRDIQAEAAGADQ